jgi:hypothetical protein
MSLYIVPMLLVVWLLFIGLLWLLKKNKGGLSWFYLISWIGFVGIYWTGLRRAVDHHLLEGPSAFEIALGPVIVCSFLVSAFTNRSFRFDGKTVAASLLMFLCCVAASVLMFTMA